VIDKAERFLDSINRSHIGRLLALDHDYRDVERTGSGDLAVGRSAAAVLGDDHLDPVLRQEAAFGGFLERAGSEDVARIGNVEGRYHRIDTADDVVMMWGALEMERLLSPDGQENAPRRFAECTGRIGDGTDAGPTIARLLFPRGTAQGKKRNAGFVRCNRRVVRNSRREGMRCVDQKLEILSLEETGKPLAATETAAAHRNRLGHGLRRPSGEREQQIAIRATCQGGGQLPRFRGAAEDQDAVFAHG